LKPGAGIDRTLAALADPHGGVGSSCCANARGERENKGRGA
jgi:hypothetical protein